MVKTLLPPLVIVPPAARFRGMLRFVTLMLAAVRVPREHIILPDTLSDAPDIAPSCDIDAFGRRCPTYKLPFVQVRL